MGAMRHVLLETFGSAAVSLRLATLGSASPVGAKRRPLQATSDVENAPPRILVVEPDASCASLLRSGLTKAGFDVVIAATGDEAHRLLSPSQPLPSLVIAEAQLRGPDGFSFCEQLRADFRTTHLPVLLLTSSPEAAEAQTRLASDVGADDLLSKPLFLQDVISLARLKTQPAGVDGRFEAHTDTLPLSQIVRALLAGMRSGQIIFARGEGRLTFRKGQIIEASYEGMRGEIAARRLLVLGEGAYTVAYGPAVGRGSVSISLRELCTRLLPEATRFRQALAVGVPLEAHLAIEPKQAALQIHSIPAEIEPFLRLFDGHRTVLSAVLESGLTEATALAAATRLYGLGILVPLADEPPGPTGVPHFFAPGQALQKPLSPELVRQLDAFQIRTVSELPPEPMDPVALDELPQAPAPELLNRALAPIVASSPADPDPTDPHVETIARGRHGNVVWLVVASALICSALAVISLL